MSLSPNEQEQFSIIIDAMCTKISIISNIIIQKDNKIAELEKELKDSQTANEYHRRQLEQYQPQPSQTENK